MKWNDGQAAVELKDARVELQVIEGPAIRVSPRGNIQPDGTFVLTTYRPDDGAPAGEYRAIIMPWAPPADEGNYRPPIVEERLLSFQTTPLRVTIKPGPNELEFTVDRRR